MGETQEERIEQFLEENEAPVVGLREGSMLRVQDGAVLLKGPHGARIFRRNANPAEAKAGDDIQQFLLEASNSVGQVA
jgi:dipeptidase E